ncbi:MAG: pyridoxamine 5'-phosphate oxidase, partial [Bradymonadaceae bacterium]
RYPMSSPRHLDRRSEAHVVDTNSNDPTDDIPLDDPVEWFDRWFERARRTDLRLPNAVTLATVSPDGRPRARTVLLKEHGPSEFVFYTNYSSTKAEDLEHDPRAALVVHWEPLDRQIRIEGEVERVSEARSDDYFATRPRASQIGAWASDQSAPLASREALIERFEQVREEFEGEPVPRPDDWGGYRVIPHRMEFWRAGPHRLHDRWEFKRPAPDAEWSRQRLNP